MQAQMASGASEKLQQDAERIQKRELTFRTTMKVSNNSGFLDKTFTHTTTAELTDENIVDFEL